MSTQRALETEFHFAGFAWPRYVADFAQGPVALRRKREQRKSAGGYYHAPRPNANDGRGFYLGDAAMPAPRWVRAADVWSGACTYATDDDGCGTMFGIVLRLPHGRYLAGWSMGEGMASACSGELFTNEHAAARDADEQARIAAEAECEYQAAEQARLDEEEREADTMEEGA